MRDILTALAVFLIVLLTAALAGPYFVDWNAQRGFVEARLSHALGQKVTIGGTIDLKLLPTPYLVLDQAVIGGDDGPIRLGIRHLDLELSVTPLLHGEFDIVEARLEEPTIRVTLQRDRTLPPLPDAPAFDADVRFDRIAIIDGTLAIADPLSGHTLALEHLDFEAEVASLAGPFKGGGAAGPADARTKFRFASTTAQNGRTRSRLVVDETPRHAGVDIDGVLTLSSAAKDRIRQTFDGTVSLTGHLDDGGDSLLPWHLSGPLHAAPDQATLGDGELRIGGEARSLTLVASGTARFGETPDLHLGLVGKQLDIDRVFAAAPADAGGGATPHPPDLAALRRTFTSAAPLLPTTLDVSVETATYGGEALAAIEATLPLNGDGAQPLRLSGEGPGRSHLAIDGTLTPGPDRTFQGSVAFSADDAPAVLAWLRTVAPDVSIETRDIPFRVIDAKARIAIGGAGTEARDLTLRLDRSALTGSARFVPAGVRPALLAANLQAKALDLDALPDLNDLRTRLTATDLDLRLDAHAIKVARVADGTLDAGRIRFALTQSGGRFALNGLRIEGLGGATIDANATFDQRGGAIDARLDAAKLVDAAALFRRVVPGVWADALVARAPALAPARLSATVALKPLDASGSLVPTAFNIAGTLGATSVQAKLAPDPANEAAVVASGALAAPEGSVLLRQIGFPTLALNNLGASRVAVAARGPPGGSLAATIDAAFGSTTVGIAGTMTGAAADRAGAGTIRLASRDVSPLLQSMALAFPDLMGRIPADLTGGVAWGPAGLSFADVKGQVGGVGATGSLLWRPDQKAEPALTGTLVFDHLTLATLLGLALGPPQPTAADALWSNAQLGSGLVDPPKTRLDLKAKTFEIRTGLNGQDAALTLGVSQGLVELKALKARLAGGEARADVSLRRDGPNAAVEGKLVLDGVGLDLPSATGRLTGHIDLAGSGKTAMALVASLGGTGDAAIGDLRIPRADDTALPKVFDDVEADRVSVDEDSIVRALDEAAKGPLAAGPRQFAVSLAAGVLHFDAKTAAAAAAGPVSSTISAALDLRKPTIDERVEQTLHALPKNWSGPPPQIVVMLAGPLKAPTRTTDISAFINALATRALARESARIEAYEFDVHERAFFNQRLQVDRRREQDRMKAEEDARLAAEAARRAKETAARLERAAEERAAQERAAQERAAQERASRERAAQERAQQERQRAVEPPPGAPPFEQPSDQSPGNPTDPSAAGRY